MPFGDGTGPRGQGPETGRGAGYCAGFNRPGIANFGFGRRGGRGFGRGFGAGRGPGRGPGFGRGFRDRYYEQVPESLENEVSKEEEINVLKEKMGSLEQALQDIKDKIQELE